MALALGPFPFLSNSRHLNRLTAGEPVTRANSNGEIQIEGNEGGKGVGKLPITGYSRHRSLYPPDPAVTLEFTKLMKGGQIKR